MSSLVIVESPAKARTLERYLGKDYKVLASVGHVRDLPVSGLGVDKESFEPEWVTVTGKGPVLKQLRAAAGRVDQVLLATDPDREGEAIAYHVAEELGWRPGAGGFRRIRFNEITKTAVRTALEEQGDLDLNRVWAQQARRILDRLVGYELSPLLWKKIRPGLSAGRVQSAALRLLVERERERAAFKGAGYWSLRAVLTTAGAEFAADLVEVGGRKVAAGRDFDQNTGKLKPRSRKLVLDGEAAETLKERLENQAFRVTGVQHRESRTSPPPPYTTATLQQEANRRLRLPARETMRLAQDLYQAGLITYMRTDSTHLSNEAISAVRKRVTSLYGADHLSARPRVYKTKSAAAQQAHEAIRPAGPGMQTADELAARHRVSGPKKRLYEMIWRRTVATQMASSLTRRTTVLTTASDAMFMAEGKVIVRPGYLRAYVEGTADPAAALAGMADPLPPLGEGDELGLRELLAREHETIPPPRYTEATLVKALEQRGIGRPSTYASIISTIVSRGYVDKEKQQLIPNFVGVAVTRLMELYFSDLVDTRFTAQMEQDLDRIAAGSVDWREYLREFYGGGGENGPGFEGKLEAGLERIDPREASTVELPFDLQGDQVTVRIGRRDPYMECGEGESRRTASIPDGLAPADLTAGLAEKLFREKYDAPSELGTDPATGETVRLLNGRYGWYVQLGGDQARSGQSGAGTTRNAKPGKAAKPPKPKRSSLPKNMDPRSVTLESALALLSLPRTLGQHPETGKPVKAGLSRFGPFVSHERDFRSLKEQDDLLTIGFDRAMELLSQPKRGGRRTSNTVICEVGPHPDDGEPIRVMNGRYGPYVQHGKVNASLGREEDPRGVDMPRALELIQERKVRMAARGGGRGGARRPKTRRAPRRTARRTAK